MHIPTLVGFIVEGLFFTTAIMGPLLYLLIHCPKKVKRKPQIHYCDKFDYILKNINSCDSYQEWINCRGWVDRLSQSRYLSEEAIEKLRQELLKKENDIERECRKQYVNTIKDTPQ